MKTDATGYNRRSNRVGSERGTGILPVAPLLGWIAATAAFFSLPVLIPFAVAAVASNLAPFKAEFPGKRTMDQSGGEIPATAQAFAPFQGRVGISWDDDFLYMESNGLPDHNMMVGITAWQQQVPLPQPYVGGNAWRVPLRPVVALEPALIKGRFLRGAIAIAVNGIPIFNPQNNRGEVSYEIGELDQWGGHCGRADDYHYHLAPVHLEAIVGKGKPLAYGLDGYPVLGLTEANGQAPRNLDECHGHDHDGLGYHYHAATKYPYVFAGFRGEVVEAEGQVDPQPRAQGVREALQALRGAEITGFEKTGADSYQLSYSVNGDKRAVRYQIGEDGTFPFEFDNGREGVTREVYRVRAGGGSGRPPGGMGGGGQRPDPLLGALDANRDGIIDSEELSDAAANLRALDRNGDGRLDREEASGRPPGGGGGKSMSPNREDGGAAARPAAPGFSLSSPAIGDDGRLPVEFTGDGDGVSPPLAWKGVPSGTKSFALIMDHLAPGDEMKSYWVMWDIPADTTSLPQNAKGIGQEGAGFRGQAGYEPPHSQGPGDKTYVLHLYALSDEVRPAGSVGRVSREALLVAMEGKVLGQADLSVVYARPEGAAGGPQKGKGGSKR